MITVDDIKKAIRKEYPAIKRHLKKYCDYDAEAIEAVFMKYEGIIKDVEKQSVAPKDYVTLVGVFGFTPTTMKMYSDAVLEMVKAEK